MELRVIYEHEEMRDMVVHVNSDGLQKIMEILADERNIIVTQLTKRPADGRQLCACIPPLADTDSMGRCEFCGCASR